jgi:hypothetical protein
MPRLLTTDAAAVETREETPEMTTVSVYRWVALDRDNVIRHIADTNEEAVAFAVEHGDKRWTVAALHSHWKRRIGDHWDRRVSREPK